MARFRSLEARLKLALAETLPIGSCGKELFPVIGSFSFVTGNVSGRKPSEWLFGAGGHVSFSGCVDVDLDHGKCDQKDFKGSC